MSNKNRQNRARSTQSLARVDAAANSGAEPLVDIDITMDDLEIIMSLLEEVLDIGIWTTAGDCVRSAKVIQKLYQKLLTKEDQADTLIMIGADAGEEVL